MVGLLRHQKGFLKNQDLQSQKYLAQKIQIALQGVRNCKFEGFSFRFHCNTGRKRSGGATSSSKGVPEKPRSEKDPDISNGSLIKLHSKLTVLL